ncbi:hypothetical protein [Streptomyces caniscabiei]|uniref:hypothetical protein n=1 Tax=Streptomyces caniscabiei TaxID=2746961 RepID=UPI000765B689|nr:hypothetical protein [Streptomyces caniscabiei]
MNDHPVHRDDIAALRKEDDLKAYMRSLLRPTRPTDRAPKRRRKPMWGAIPIPADHKPGAWPAGTQPPGPAPERSLPPEVWAEAVNRYRTEQRHQLDEEETP